MSEAMDTMMKSLEPFLNDLEARIDVEAEEALLADWQTFFRRGWTASPLFIPARLRAAPPKLA